MVTEHEKLIGKHPANPSFFAAWLDAEDIGVPADKPNKKHRKLVEIDTQRATAIQQIAELIIQHHVDIKKINRLKKRKRKILEKYNLSSIEEYTEFQSLFPADKNTRSGNATEIILSNYLQASTGLDLLAYKLVYNTNVEQSLKGDDCLLFNTKNLNDKIIVGEAKFRGTSPAPKAIKDMINNLEGSKRLPISLPFISNYLSAIGNESLAAQIEDLLFELRNGKINIVNVGLILSTKSNIRSKDTSLQVDHYLDSSNPNLVVLSLGVDNPNEIIEKAFEIANTELLKMI